MTDFKASLTYILNRLINRQGAGEGTHVPPPVHGEFRVPFAQSFTVVKTTHVFGGSLVTLSWVDPSDKNVSHFNIYVTNAFETNTQPTFVGSAPRSPANVHVLTDQTALTNVVFYIQTVLRNGLASEVSRSPTTTGQIQGGWFPDISVGGSSFATGKLKTSGGNLTLTGAGITITDATFELTLNGIKTSITNADISGVGITGLRVSDTTLTNQMSVITKSFIAIYDRDQNLSVSMARSAGDPPGAGLVRVTDGTGTGQLGSGQRIILEGDTGKVRCNGEVSIEGSQSVGGGFLHFNQTEGEAASAGTTFGYVTVKFQGEQRKIQLFNL